MRALIICKIFIFTFSCSLLFAQSPKQITSKEKINNMDRSENITEQILNRQYRSIDRITKKRSNSQKPSQNTQSRAWNFLTEFGRSVALETARDFSGEGGCNVDEFGLSREWNCE